MLGNEINFGIGNRSICGEKKLCDEWTRLHKLRETSRCAKQIPAPKRILKINHERYYSSPSNEDQINLKIAAD